MRQRRAKLMVLALGVVLTLACCTPQGQREGRYAGRNLVVVVIDTLRADRLSFHGCEIETAPFLAELAARSVVFERAWSPSSRTAPATASIFTSLYPDQHGVFDGLHVHEFARSIDPTIRLKRIPSEVVTLPEYVRDLGYRTYGISDNPSVGDDIGFDRGFDRFHTFPYRSASVVNHKLREWLPEIRNGSGPYFLYLHYMDPHYPYHQRAPWYSAERAADPRPYAADLAAYDSEIGYVDSFIAEVFELLDLENDALVFITSDHGEEFGEHGSNFHQSTLYNEITHVPLLVHASDSKPARIAGNVSTLDILPTLRELMGTPRVEHDEGQSLAAAMDGQPLRTDRAIYTMRLLDVPPFDRRAVIHESHKAIFTFTDATTELYDLVADRAERTDLSKRETAVFGRLSADMEAFRSRPYRIKAGPTEPLEADPATLEALRRLGYVDGGPP